MALAPPFQPPYYVVIFTNHHKNPDDPAYSEMGAKMEALAAATPGYLGFESVRDSEGFGVAVSYWKTKEAISRWKKQVDHLEAQRRGREEWYADYQVRVARVERAYSKKRRARDEAENSGKPNKF